ncbi:hypothetical protein SISNIDRAFT_450322, partial [Sistotremastrum niveocremeum HHB9708]
MGFYWKGDQLVARRGRPQSAEASEGQTPSPNPWTSFEMSLREPGPIPKAFDFIRFLTSSITFMAHLSSVEVYLNDVRLAGISKDSGAAKRLVLPKELNPRTSGGMMTVSGAESTTLTITTEIIRAVFTGGTEKPPVKVARPEPTKQGQSSFFSSLFSSFANSPAPRTPSPLPPVQALCEPSNLLDILKASITLTVFVAHVDVSLDQKLISELHRSTKKNPPSKLKYSLIYTGKDAYDVSLKEEKEHPQTNGSVFQGLRADLDGTGAGRIFIGHATGQTTGLGGHMAARFIPTVERESIDLVDRHVAVWNKELLYVGGYLARTAYQLELGDVKALWDAAAQSSSLNQPGIDPELRTWLQNRCLHALRFFTFHLNAANDAPALMSAAFFQCSRDGAFPIISSKGIMDARKVRLFDQSFSGFIKDLPVLPIEVADEALLMVTTLRSKGMINSITFGDVLEELRHRPLSETEMIECLKWLFALDTREVQSHKQEIRHQFLEAAILAINGPDKDERIVLLSTITTYINTRTAGSIIPLDTPLPSTTFPFSISKHLPSDQFSAFFGWNEFTILDWLRYIISPEVASKGPETDLTLSAIFAERVIQVLSKSWGSMNKDSQAQTIAMLSSKPFIPTRSGLKVASEAYFSNVDIFPDLPIVTLSKGTAVKGAVEKLLADLGVRRHVELQLIFSRMFQTGDWSTVDLVKYLASIHSTLSELEVEKLRQTSAFLAEGGPITRDPKAKRQRMKASELYEPVDAMRELGLPVLEWGTQPKWRSGSDEAKFLFQIGLRRFPILPVILDLAANSNLTIRPRALKYFLDHVHVHYTHYKLSNSGHIPFVPAVEAGGGTFLGPPNDVFIDPESAIFGFSVVDPSLRDIAASKLQLHKFPPTALIMKLILQEPARSVNQARNWFEALAGRVADFSTQEFATLANTAFIPKEVEVVGKGGRTVELKVYKPFDCYLGGDQSAEYHSELFVFVDFGPKAAHFLRACGVRNSPSVEEIAQILVADPQVFFQKTGGREGFSAELRKLAVNKHQISGATRRKMSKTACLLSFRRKPRPERKSKDKSSTDDDYEDDDAWEETPELALPEKIIVVDDTTSYSLFGDSLLAAPQEDLLEDFYLYLGSRRLSTLIREEYTRSGAAKDQQSAKELRSLILSRLPLFLYERGNTEPVLSYSWLNKEGHFRVENVNKIHLVKHLRLGNATTSRSHETSAAALREPRTGPLILWISGMVDMYEVSNTLLASIFRSHKVNDALLFSTILSTDLRALRRRGYNVDRILKQQRDERRLAEEAAARAEASRREAGPAPPPAFSPADPNGPPSFPSPIAQPPGYDDPDQKRQPGLFQNLKSRFGDTSTPSIPNYGTRPDSQSNGGPKPPVPNGQASQPQRPLSTQPTEGRGGVSSPENIQRNVQQAIKACREENASLLRNRQEMTMVRESTEESYCDVSGHDQDLERVGLITGVNVYVSKDVPNKSLFIRYNRLQLERFLTIIRPLEGVYKIPATSVNIFYDTSGQLIAFNRNGSIFLNLRYYEAWHDAQVLDGNRSQAFVSWYFTLAHEIAHNLVQLHNAEHEFYFSSICEAHMKDFAK